MRELRNLVERAVIESGGGEIQPEHLHFVFPSAPPASSGLAAAAQSTAPRRPPAIAPDDAGRILAYVREKGSINNAQCRELLGVGMHRAWYLLRQLHRADLLKQDSSGRWAHYHLP